MSLCAAPWLISQAWQMNVAVQEAVIECSADSLPDDDHVLLPLMLCRCFMIGCTASCIKLHSRAMFIVYRYSCTMLYHFGQFLVYNVIQFSTVTSVPCRTISFRCDILCMDSCIILFRCITLALHVLSICIIFCPCYLFFVGSFIVFYRCDI